MQFTNAQLLHCILISWQLILFFVALGDCLQWFGYKVQIKLRVSLMKRSSAISEHLKKVEINCQKVDNTVLKVLKFLCAFNICKITCNASHSFIFLTFTVMSIYMKESMQPSKLVRKSWMVGPKVPIYRWISTFCHEFFFYLFYFFPCSGCHMWNYVVTSSKRL